MSRQDDKTEVFELAKIRLKRISSQTFQRVEEQRHPKVFTCCKVALEDHCYRDTCIPDTVYTECGHYVTVREIGRRDD